MSAAAPSISSQSDTKGTPSLYMKDGASVSSLVDAERAEKCANEAKNNVVEIDFINDETRVSMANDLFSKQKLNNRYLLRPVIMTCWLVCRFGTHGPPLLEIG